MLTSKHNQKQNQPTQTNQQKQVAVGSYILDVDEGDYAARRKAAGLAEFLAVHGLLRARRGWICGCSSAAASLYSPTAVCLQQAAAGLVGEPRVTTISIHASIAQPFFF